jgi:hypothetical protein
MRERERERERERSFAGFLAGKFEEGVDEKLTRRDDVRVHSHFVL